MNILYDERLDGPVPQFDRTAIRDSLAQAIPGMTLLDREEDMRPFECDGLSVYRTLPMLVAMPDSLDQVQRLLQECHRLGVPVVTRGAGTGLSAGALTLAHEIGGEHDGTLVPWPL